MFNPAAIREFTPNFENATPVAAAANANAATNGGVQDGGAAQYDPYAMGGVGQALPAAQFNPYAEDPTGMGAHGSAYYQNQAAFAAPLQPLQYHLYAPIGPYKDDLLPFHRMTHDFFMPDKLREEMQKKTEAALQVMPNSQLPQLDNYHSLVALDTSGRKNVSLFGYTTWVYKATSMKTGHIYCLRRIEGFRLTNEHAIRSVKEWRKVCNGNVVAIHDAFTARAFGDSSLIFVQDYHPLAKTLTDVHLTPTPVHGGRFQPKPPISESVMWAYISQIANALKSIHNTGLAARCIDPSKIILTDKNRIRLNACSVLDVLQFEPRRPIAELQQEDMANFGRTMLCLATGTLPAVVTNNMKILIDQMGRTYSPELRDTITWLVAAPQPNASKTIDDFLRGISLHLVTTFDQSQHQADELNSELYRELENGRVARLMMKLGTINERHEFDGEHAWSENGERYMLKLFRDYVFHQVDASGKPVLDMGHMMRSLNKLDAGIDEKICLTSRDEQTSFIVSYKELKKQLNNAFTELQKGGKQNRGL